MEGFLGSGDLYMDRLTTAGGAQGLTLLGNATKFELEAKADTKDLVSKKRDTAGQLLASVTKGQPPTISITLNEYDKDILATAFLGEATAQTGAGGTITDEVITGIADKYVEVSHRVISAVTVSRKGGDDAVAWVAATAYAVGDYVVPSSANQHMYKCTVAGTSDATTEPTWPTDGTTVVDATATWQDMGLIIATVDTDYLLQDRLGMMQILSSGSIEDGEQLNVDYTWSAQDGYDITVGTTPMVKCRFILDGINDVNGKNCIVDILEANVKPSGLIDFLADDYAEVTLEGTIITPAGQTTTAIIDYHE